MRVEGTQINATATFAAMAAAWPVALCAITDATATPLQHALQNSWCGAAPRSLEFLGHCPACWGGAAAFLLAATLTLAAPRPLPLRAGG